MCHVARRHAGSTTASGWASPEKKGPLPVTTMALTPGSDDAQPSSPRNSAISRRDSAFRFSGRLSVMSLTPSAGDVAWTRPEADADMLVISVVYGGTVCSTRDGVGAGKGSDGLQAQTNTRGTGRDGQRRD